MLGIEVSEAVAGSGHQGGGWCSGIQDQSSDLPQVDQGHLKQTSGSEVKPLSTSSSRFRAKTVEEAQPA